MAGISFADASDTPPPADEPNWSYWHGEQPCPECDDTGLYEAYQLDGFPGEWQEVFCDCSIGQRMMDDYASDQVDREERQWDAPTIGELYRSGKLDIQDFTDFGL